jgi:hypothetical protein
MLKLYELRIGNFFQIELMPTHRKRIKKISEIKQKHILLDGSWYYLDKLIPIPLTEEVLLKCGFEKFIWVTESNVYKLDDFNCRLDEDGVQVFGANFNNMKPLKYLHELQNLYFDFTGRELMVEFKDADTRQVEDFPMERDFVLLGNSA